MKKIILIVTLLLIVSLEVTLAQNVFKKYGFKKEVLTLSKGKYQEIFRNSEVVQIGTVLVNTKTNKVVKLLNEDTTKTTYNAELSSRFLTIDPLAEKYYSISPYAYALNNPIRVIDPDGRDVVVLNAPKGAGNHGHMAAIIQDKQGNWYYMTMGVTENGSVSKMSTQGVNGGMGIVEIGTKDRSKALEFAKADKNNSEYTQQLDFKTSPSMDEKIFNSAVDKQTKVNNGEEKYNVLNNNCADAVKQVIETGTGVELPAKVDPSPNSYFQELKDNKITIQSDIYLKMTTERLIQDAKKSLQDMEKSIKK